MITAPTNWTNLYDTTDSHMELKVNIGGTDYYGENMAAGDFKIQHALYDAFGIGNVCSAQFSVTLLDITGSIPDGVVRVIPYCRLTDGDRDVKTDWVMQGVFYLDTISEDIDEDLVTITAYDALLLAEQDYYDDGSGDSDNTAWPQSTTAVVAAICTKLGVSLDSRSQIGSGNISKPSYKTVREVLSEIAILSGGNWTMTKDGKLRLIPLTGQVTTSVSEIKSVADIRITSNPTMISQLILKKSANEKFTSGTITDYTVEGEYDGATQAITDAVFLKVTGKLYQGFSITGAYFDPLLEIGDPVKITLGENSWYIPFDSYSCLYEEGCWGDIAAPLDMEVQHRIRYSHSQASKTDRQIQQAIKESKDYTDEKTSGGGGGGGEDVWSLDGMITMDPRHTQWTAKTIPAEPEIARPEETVYYYEAYLGQGGASSLPKLSYKCSYVPYKLWTRFTPFNAGNGSVSGQTVVDVDSEINTTADLIQVNAWAEFPVYKDMPAEEAAGKKNRIRVVYASPRIPHTGASGTLYYHFEVPREYLDLT